MFQKATKTQARLRFAIAGPSVSGKTYNALKIGQQQLSIVLIDTEHGSASKCADLFDFATTLLTTIAPASTAIWFRETNRLNVYC